MLALDRDHHRLVKAWRALDAAGMTPSDGLVALLDRWFRHVEPEKRMSRANLRAARRWLNAWRHPYGGATLTKRSRKLMRRRALARAAAL